jgi:hypothetical protein
MMQRHLPLAAVVLLGGGILFGQTAPDRTEITALTKSFLRDSAELPMTVAVETVVTNAKGKKVRNTHSMTEFVFRGYNGLTGNASFKSNAGLMSYRILHDSIGPNFAILDAFTALAPHPEGLADVAVEGGQSGEPFLLKTAAECKELQFAMSGQFPYPNKKCYATEFRVRKGEAGEWTIERFGLDVAELPAPGKIPYLGLAQIRKVHAEGELQAVRLPDDPRPFLIPKRVTVSIESDKGTAVVTNQYTLKTPARK